MEKKIMWKPKKLEKIQVLEKRFNDEKIQDKIKEFLNKKNIQWNGGNLKDFWELVQENNDKISRFSVFKELLKIYQEYNFEITKEDISLPLEYVNNILLDLSDEEWEENQDGGLFKIYEEKFKQMEPEDREFFSGKSEIEILRQSPNARKQSIIEAVANGIDAMSDQKIGEKGLGIKQALAYILDGGKIEVVSRQINDTNIYYLKIENKVNGNGFQENIKTINFDKDGYFKNGTELIINPDKLITEKEIEQIREKILKTFRLINGIDIYLNNELINQSKNILDSNGIELKKDNFDKKEIRVEISQDKIIVRDNGSGMDKMTLMKMFIPRQGTKRMEDIETESKKVEVCFIRNEGKSGLNIARKNEILESYDFEKDFEKNQKYLNLLEEEILINSNFLRVPEARQSIFIDEDFFDTFQRAINKVLGGGRSFEDKIKFVNSLTLYLDRFLEEKNGGNQGIGDTSEYYILEIKKALREKVFDLLKKENKEKKLIPNDLFFQELLTVEDKKEGLLLNSEIFDFKPEDLNNFQKARYFDSDHIFEVDLDKLNNDEGEKKFSIKEYQKKYFINKKFLDKYKELSGNDFKKLVLEELLELGVNKVQTSYDGFQERKYVMNKNELKQKFRNFEKNNLSNEEINQKKEEYEKTQIMIQLSKIYPVDLLKTGESKDWTSELEDFFSNEAVPMNPDNYKKIYEINFGDEWIGDYIKNIIKTSSGELVFFDFGGYSHNTSILIKNEKIGKIFIEDVIDYTGSQNKEYIGDDLNFIFTKDQVYIFNKDGDMMTLRQPRDVKINASSLKEIRKKDNGEYEVLIVNGSRNLFLILDPELKSRSIKGFENLDEYWNYYVSEFNSWLAADNNFYEHKITKGDMNVFYKVSFSENFKVFIEGEEYDLKKELILSEKGEFIGILKDDRVLFLDNGVLIIVSKDGQEERMDLKYLYNVDEIEYIEYSDDKEILFVKTSEGYILFDYDFNLIRNTKFLGGGQPMMYFDDGKIWMEEEEYWNFSQKKIDGWNEEFLNKRKKVQENLGDDIKKIIKIEKIFKEKIDDGGMYWIKFRNSIYDVWKKAFEDDEIDFQEYSIKYSIEEISEILDYLNESFNRNKIDKEAIFDGDYEWIEYLLFNKNLYKNNELWKEYIDLSVFSKNFYVYKESIEFLLSQLDRLELKTVEEKREIISIVCANYDDYLEVKEEEKDEVKMIVSKILLLKEKGGLYNDFRKSINVEKNGKKGYEMFSYQKDIWKDHPASLYFDFLKSDILLDVENVEEYFIPNYAENVFGNDKKEEVDVVNLYYWGKKGKIFDEEIANKIEEGPKKKTREGFEHQIKKEILGQGSEKNVYVRELLQNMIDISKKQYKKDILENGEKESLAQKIEISVYEEINQVENKRYFVDKYHDYGGGIPSLVNLLVAQINEKSGKGDESGFFGSGFLSIFEDADKVQIKTIAGEKKDKIKYIDISVKRNEKNKVEGIAIDKYKIAPSEMNFQGTEIMRKVELKGGEFSELQYLMMKSAFDKNTINLDSRFFDDNKLNVYFNDEKVEKKSETLVEEKMKVNGEEYKIKIDAGAISQVLSGDGLRMSGLDRKYTELVPRQIFDLIHEKEVSLVLDKKILLIKDRSMIVDEDIFLPEIQKQFAVGMIKIAVKDLIQNNRKFIGFPDDYFENLNYSFNYDDEEGVQIKEIADRINNNEIEALTLEDFQLISDKGFDQNSSFAKLAVLIKIDGLTKEDGYGKKEKISLAEIRVNKLVKELKEQGKKNISFSSDYLLNNVYHEAEILGLDIKDEEEYDLNIDEENFGLDFGVDLDAQMETVVKTKKEFFENELNEKEKEKFELFRKTIVGLGVEEVKLLEMDHSAGVYYPNLNILGININLLKKDGEIKELTETIIHELAHYYEGTSGDHRKLTRYTHQSEGSFGEAYKKAVKNVLSKIFL